MTQSITLKAYAKINLSLEVVRRREDGYHDILSFMQDLGLYDVVTMKTGATLEQIQTAPDIKYHDNNCFIGDIAVKFCMDTNTISLGKDNLALRGVDAVVKAVSAKTILPNALQITVEKRLPIAAGIAGGSGNAAACMLAMNALLGHPLSLGELMDVGKTVGADVPFSLMMNARKNNSVLRGLEGLENSSVAAHIAGIGELVTPATPISRTVILMNPGIAVSTREVYEELDAIRGREVNDALFFNRMEEYTLSRYSAASELKRAMQERLRAEHIVMSGSGPTIVAYYQDESMALEDYERTQGDSWVRPEWRIWCTTSGGENYEY